MSDVDLDKVRRRALTAHMYDGLFELYIGFALFFIGLTEVLGHYTESEGYQTYYTPVLVVFPLFLLFIAKRKITRPRIGYVDFKNSRHTISWSKMVLVWVGIIALVALVYLIQHLRGLTPAEVGFKVALKQHVGLYTAIFISAILSTMAVMGELPRWHLGSLLFLVVFGILYAFDLFPGIGFVVCGIVLLLVGGMSLRAFIRNNPVLPPDAFAEEEAHERTE
ncbi:hypothetical protein KQI63_08800 [bacterium]|nr:hypothetical protein [bacterium]